MNSSQILCALESDVLLKKYQIGVFANDKIPYLGDNSHIAYIINSAPANHTGEHWVAVYKDHKNEINIFDSFGKHPLIYLSLELINQDDSIVYQTGQLQQNTSDYCGQYCIFFVHMKAKGWNMQKICNLFNIKDKIYNDKLVNAFVTNNYSCLESQNCFSKQSCTALNSV